MSDVVRRASNLVGVNLKLAQSAREGGVVVRAMERVNG